MPTSSLVGSTSTVAWESGAEITPSPRTARLASLSNFTPRQAWNRPFCGRARSFRRCRRADQVLRDRPNVVRVFITAQLEDRVSTVSEEQHLRMANARKKVEEIDKLRANYYGELNGKVWGQADNYDVCLNISAIDEAGAVFMIEKAVEGKLIQMDLKAAQKKE